MVDPDIRVLVVDDEGAVRFFLERFFRREGHPVVGVADGREAIERLEEESFDLLFTDIRMPHVSGTELLEAVRESHPGLPVVLMTAFQDEEATERYIEMADAFLQKPFRVEDLRRVFSEITGLPADETPAEGTRFEE